MSRSRHLPRDPQSYETVNDDDSAEYQPITADNENNDIADKMVHSAGLAWSWSLSQIYYKSANEEQPDYIDEMAPSCTEVTLGRRKYSFSPKAKILIERRRSQIALDRLERRNSKRAMKQFAKDRKTGIAGQCATPRQYDNEITDQDDNVQVIDLTNRKKTLILIKRDGVILQSLRV